MSQKKILKDKKCTGGKGEGQDIMLAISKRKHNNIIGLVKASKRANKHSQNDNKQQQAKKTTLLLHKTKQADQ